MQPKDLMGDLEKGDRTREQLTKRESADSVSLTVGVAVGQIVNDYWGGQSANQAINARANQMQAAQNVASTGRLGNIATSYTGGTLFVDRPEF